VRAIGSPQQGLLGGVEYLGRGEASSSRLDIEGDAHLRFLPDPLNVTMPLMAFRTEHCTVALRWDDMELQPAFATPNRFDGTGDHRMSLRGTQINAAVWIGDGPLEESILWAVKRRGLPPLPEPPRSVDEQWELCLTALRGPLRNEEGWGHCLGSRWQRRPFADMASTLWRLTGEAAPFPQFVPGGAHLPNDAIYFATGRAQQWLDSGMRKVDGLIARQKPDGSYRYEGKYRRGHFEDTASGYCARPAAELLEFAFITGDQRALAAAMRTLDYMKRFRTPRGAQTWELSLHTPDLLASGYLVWAYVRGYELTGNREYLAAARKWALSGMPFVYQWSRYPVMAYATTPVFGATNWTAPVWIGKPVQWVGLVYAHALSLLGEHDATLDWRHVARGILIAGEQMQYRTGSNAGLLPDVWLLRAQAGRPADINPCALVSLRMTLDGEVAFLDVATEGKRRVAAPFPVDLRDGKAHVRGRAGMQYQILVDGRHIVDVKSQGDDTVGLPKTED
jgi:hypothetical protein